MSENKFSILRQDKDSKILVVTPLYIHHKVSKDTKKTIKRNKTPFTWITSEGKHNIPTNLEKGLLWFEENHKMPEYYIMIDNDIVLGRNMLDRLYHTLKNERYLNRNIAFSYASFSFRGTINHDFPADPFDIQRLTKHNYISSNSMFVTEITKEVGLVTNDKYKRLLDWAFLLKLVKHGYSGAPCDNAHFIARSEPKDISAGSKNDYVIKRKRVLDDFFPGDDIRFEILKRGLNPTFNQKFRRY